MFTKCDPVQQKVHLVCHIYFEIINKKYAKYMENNRKYRLCKGIISKSITSIFRNWVSLESLLNPLLYFKNLNFFRSRHFIMCIGSQILSVTFEVFFS